VSSDASGHAHRPSLPGRGPFGFDKIYSSPTSHSRAFRERLCPGATPCRFRAPRIDRPELAPSSVTRPEALHFLATFRRKIELFQAQPRGGRGIREKAERIVFWLPVGSISSQNLSASGASIVIKWRLRPAQHRCGSDCRRSHPSPPNAASLPGRDTDTGPNRAAASIR